MLGDGAVVNTHKIAGLRALAPSRSAAQQPRGYCIRAGLASGIPSLLFFGRWGRARTGTRRAPLPQGEWVRRFSVLFVERALGVEAITPIIEQHVLYSPHLENVSSPDGLTALPMRGYHRDRNDILFDPTVRLLRDSTITPPSNIQFKNRC